jgi:AraC-like DNA-binding protein
MDETQTKEAWSLVEGFAAYGFNRAHSTAYSLLGYQMAYLKVQRLHGVRRSLKLADPEISSVMAIANQFGFWSAGHFSRDYQKMFGELPSATIKN